MPRGELMGASKKRGAEYAYVTLEMGRGKKVKVKVPREAACS